MSSVQVNMLRSESGWFPRFIAICVARHRWMHPHEEDYDWMKRVSECDSKRQVESVLKEYNHPDFTDGVHSLQETARKIIAIENDLRSRGDVLL